MQRPRRSNRQGGRGGRNDQIPEHLRNRPWHTLPQQSSSHTLSNSSGGPRPAPAYKSVPSYESITIGTAVSIVLKQDQPTGHQVQGIVGEVLTGGDHPRGVKVRLRDGRVGRVQKLVSDDEGELGEELVGGKDASLGRDGEGGRSFGAEQGFAPIRRDERRGGRDRGRGSEGRRERGGFQHVQDVRNDDYVWDENRNMTLGTYFLGLETLEAKDAEDQSWRGVSRESRGSELKGAIATCPVCGTFEGDERAVAHHVEGHFADG